MHIRSLKAVLALLGICLAIIPGNRVHASGDISISYSSIRENLPAYSVVGMLGSSLNSGRADWGMQAVLDSDLPFMLRQDTLLTTSSLNYEADSVYEIMFRLRLGDSLLAESVITIRVEDLTGKFDQNGVADSAVASCYPGVSSGDFLFLNPNIDHKNLFYGFGFGSIQYPNKILVRAGTYDKIVMNLDSVRGESTDRRVIITNFLGQVKARKVLLEGGENWRLTGHFDPVLPTGHEEYPGCVSEGSTVNFGFSHGQYGWWIANQYSSEDNGLTVNGGATRFEIDHVEISDGGFAGVMIKSKPDSKDMEDFHLHHLYIHDVGGEGMYLGSTESDPQHQLNGIRVEHCAVLRTGAEALQAGQLGPGCIFRHNVLWGGMDWLSPFGFHQDHGVQLAIRNGGIIFENNIILGAGNAFFNLQLDPIDGEEANGDSLIIRNNLAWQARGPLGAYMAEETNGETPVIWRENYFGGFRYDYDRVYASRPFEPEVIRVASLGIPVVFRDNVMEEPKERLFRSWHRSSATLINMGNHLHPLPAPEFRNLAGANQDYTSWHHFTPVIGADSTFPAKNTWKGDSVLYRPGEVVGMSVNGETRYFRCLQETYGQVPDPEGNETWQWLAWTNGDKIQSIPPDDVRLDTGSFYYARNIGMEKVEVVSGDLLLDNEDKTGHLQLQVTPNPSNGRFRIIAPGAGPAASVRVMSATGQVLHEQLLTGIAADVHLRGVARGVYVIMLNQHDQQYAARLVVE